MRTANCLPLCLWCCAVVLASLVIDAQAVAQQFQFGIGGPAPAELSKPRVDLIFGATAARLEQARALANDKNWDEAINTLRELAADDTSRVVALDEYRYVSLRTYCHLQLASLPTDGLAAYRRRVDPLAEQWYRQGLGARDERLLHRVADEMFCSSWGDDALMALGELALERADYDAARRCWEQTSPLLRDPTGLPLWLALRNVDLSAHWTEIERRWLERTTRPDWLAYPDTQLDLADLRARLILVSLRAGELERATIELDAFRRFHPMAAGRLGGQVGPYVAALERLLASAQEWPAAPREWNWPSFAGSLSRSSAAPPLGPIVGPAWPKPVRLVPPQVARIDAPPVGSDAFGGGAIEEMSIMATREADRPLSCFPIIVDGVILFADGAAIQAVELATGKPAITPTGVLQNYAPFDESNLQSAFSMGARVAHGAPRFTLTAVNGIVYGRVGPLVTAQNESPHTLPGDRLVGLDLARDGLLAFRARPPDPEWSFDGVPVSDGRRLFVAMRQSDVSPRANVACFDAATGTELWRTGIGAADTPAAGRDEITHNLLTLVGDRIYFNTNLGLVAALDATDGKICWLHRYDRVSGAPMSSRPGPLHFHRDPSPCLHHNGLLIVAPSDTPSVFAIDADTGLLVWASDELANALHLLGVVRQNLVVSGHRLWTVDVRSGDVRFAWPESEHAGIRGMGRGVLAGDEIFWPTRTEVHIIHAVTGERTRTPISLRPIGNGGANLAVARGYLVAAGHHKLIAFGPAVLTPTGDSQTPNAGSRERPVRLSTLNSQP